MTVGARVGGTLRARGLRQGLAEDETAILEEEEEETAEQEQGKRAPKWQTEEESSGRSSKQVAFAILPAHYKPLGADGEQQAQEASAERRSRKRRRKLKKYGKNVGKVLQKGCRYVVLGLQSLANAYSSPFGVAASVATLFR
ncbi:uncharacterized protein C1orf115 homolog [Sphaerodactylus townsendi]|uniref:uncharacterized protein C1orf115 homolog n=1 Tax=Sphaerodactylus townsendi TaxID=933632 RepID=UPI002026B4B9|nr:uncharacterized protein C1orf115 homolog [Sphaerodactylus townsendi]